MIRTNNRFRIFVYVVSENSFSWTPNENVNITFYISPNQNCFYFSKRILVMILIYLFLTFIVLLLLSVNSITCDMGYGQRGLHYENGITWPRNCKETAYCWQTTTEDIQIMKDLFDYQWDPYYDTFYIKGCGGEWGSPLKNPYILTLPVLLVNGRYSNPVWMPDRDRQYVTLNITRNSTITTKGGHAVMSMTYACDYDFCSSASALNKDSSKLMLISLIGVLSVCYFGYN